MSGGVSSLLPIFSIFTVYVAWFVVINSSLTRAQNVTHQPTTAPSEVRALNSIFEQWMIKANTQQWNISGEPCSGAALDDSIDIDSFNPFIKCNCNFNNGSLCHITKLKVQKMNVAGPIPEELWTLTFLNDLNLGNNFLTGSLSPSIGNLINMKTLALSANALSGEVPKELGLLTELFYLYFSVNNFSGPLPPELGNLNKLEHLSGVSGEIPSTYENLKSLEAVFASDTELTGKIPDFIGSWSNLTTLVFQGNSFQGPIPSTFANLTSLVQLRLSDISNASSSLAFVANMKSLETLELRNNDIIGSIPWNIGELTRLKHLDLSFNKLNGQIPDSLFNMSALQALFLGNNSLSGTLTRTKSAPLLTIDLSYNNLVGIIPSWVYNQQNLHINLVGNNFMIDNSNNSTLLSGLNCLQKSFPCNRGRPLYYNFGINSGGKQMTSSNGLVYEEDDQPLGPATHFVTSSRRWAVSNVGIFAWTNDLNTSSSQFTSTFDTELFLTARISASSLRYYGLGLENGNYTVKLQFAEIALENSLTWKSTGRRVFDIYIQGNRVIQNFDIKKEAGGISFRAVQKEFKARVSQNYLEIHLFWAGKGTCCIPVYGNYGPSISAISATPDFTPTVSNLPPTISNKKSRTSLIVEIIVGTVILSLLSVLVACYVVQRRNKSQMNDDDELLGMDVKPLTFGYAELRTATNNFDSSNKLGEGGFGPVFMGTLEDGRVIAVKQLSVTSHQGKSQFVAEIATITAVQHRNLVKLYGCCIEGEKRLLVYEYMENKSLDQALFGNQSLNLNWPTRFDICLGIARGLAYLHEESRLRIVHRDVKCSNILLDSDLIPKISDFGLAKLYDDKMTHISTRVAGTIGYLAPEYAMLGHLTEKTDVFAFGVVALEIVTGRPNYYDSSLDEGKTYLLDLAWNLHEEDREIELVDSKLSEFIEEEVRRIIRVAFLCTRTSPSARPSMSKVVAILSGDIDMDTEVSRPGYLVEWKFNDVNSLMSRIAQGTDPTLYASHTSISMEADAMLSPGDRGTHPMLQNRNSG
ncbi:probable LRR receptor-like serine/threonine-protein kinase At1g56140 isoform X2 [Humulus lupulus]|uniref:probable LRR receptor-like serine/threonine-protein kinase At1g56140 isoform X2 n=1 Tax=Humulus lupulus TaxID=3486 RepID=UPI002B41800A|nr:probable LRR receptor-like serine/threonine-protein kinase At1g56140 isoform X2 [Humulus lupulus]